jgi:O-antigen/teichoic acid export membrane protein
MKISLAHNILANYVSQVYVTLIAIVSVPLIVRYMGVEAYGLVGFFAMLQIWFQLLDMGLTPTMAREVATFRGGGIDGLSLRRLLRSLEGIFIAVGVMGTGALILAADAIAVGWLNVEHLPLAEVKNAIVLMAFISALRWVCELYRGAISGFEDQVWLSGLNVAIATGRFVLVIPFLVYVGTTPTYFFGFQLAVEVLQLAALVSRTYLKLPAQTSGTPVPWQWQPLRRVLKFSLSMAFIAFVWTLKTQLDKLVLSKLLSLTEYAYFMLAVLLASGVTLISGPISMALLPRLTSLSAKADEVGLISLYRNATQLVGAIAVPAAAMLALFPEQVLWAWTGDAVIARAAAPVLTLYALGNAILAFGAFPYYLQFAKGDLRLHLIVNTLFLVLLLPAMIFSTIKFGAVGAGYAWLCSNALYFLLYVPRVHRRFMGGLHVQWLLHDIAGIVLATAAGAVFIRLFFTWPEDRALTALGVVAVSAALMAAAIAGSPWLRERISGRWSARLAGR